MSRTKIVDELTEFISLDHLIPIYGKNNDELKSLKKIVDADNSKIKELIKEQKKVGETLSAGGYEAVLSIRKSESINEDKLLEIARKHNLDIIKTKEYIDFDLLEGLIYNGQIDGETLMEIDGCREVKTSEVLTVKKAKIKGDIVNGK